MNSTWKKLPSFNGEGEVYVNLALVRLVEPDTGDSINSRITFSDGTQMWIGAEAEEILSGLEP
jgi:hypothetical protein